VCVCVRERESEGKKQKKRWRKVGGRVSENERWGGRKPLRV